jgi:serine/threonine protein kinase
MLSGEVVAVGGNGTIRRHPTNPRLVIKVLPMTGPGGGSFLESIAEEVFAMRSLYRLGQSPPVKKLFGRDDIFMPLHGTTALGGSIGIMMPSYKQNLREVACTLGMDQTNAFAAEVASQLFPALDIMHGINFAHLDIKPDNIMVSGNHRITIADYGSAALVIEGLMPLEPELCTTEEYRAPEVFMLQLDPTGKPFGLAVDIWSAGLTILELLSQEEMIVQRADPKTTLARINALFGNQASGKRKLNQFDRISPFVEKGMLEFLRGVIEIDSETRWTAKEASAHLNK